MMNSTVTIGQMKSYLQAKMDKFQRDLERYGIEDRMVQKEMDAMIACKEMVEVLVDMPVNLQQDGKVTFGF